MELITKRDPATPVNQLGIGTQIQDIPDRTAVYSVDGVGTTETNAPVVDISTYRTVVICKHVDASNLAVQLGIPAFSGMIAEVYALNGAVTVFLWQGTFLDGGTSDTVSKGARYVSVSNGTYITWARLG